MYCGATTKIMGPFFGIFSPPNESISLKKIRSIKNKNRWTNQYSAPIVEIEKQKKKKMSEQICSGGTFIGEHNNFSISQPYLSSQMTHLYLYIVNTTSLLTF